MHLKLLVNLRALSDHKSSLMSDMMCQLHGLGNEKKLPWDGVYIGAGASVCEGKQRCGRGSAWDLCMFVSE